MLRDKAKFATLHCSSSPCSCSRFPWVSTSRNVDLLHRSYRERDEHGRLPHHWLAAKAQTQTWHILAYVGVQSIGWNLKALLTRDNKGKTPLDIACRSWACADFIGLLSPKLPRKLVRWVIRGWRVGVWSTQIQQFYSSSRYSFLWPSIQRLPRVSCSSKDPSTPTFS